MALRATRAELAAFAKTPLTLKWMSGEFHYFPLPAKAGGWKGASKSKSLLGSGGIGPAEHGVKEPGRAGHKVGAVVKEGIQRGHDDTASS